MAIPFALIWEYDPVTIVQLISEYAALVLSRFAIAAIVWDIITIRSYGHFSGFRCKLCLVAQCMDSTI